MKTSSHLQVGLSAVGGVMDKGLIDYLEAKIAADKLVAEADKIMREVEFIRDLSQQAMVDAGLVRIRADLAGAGIVEARLACFGRVPSRTATGEIIHGCIATVDLAEEWDARSLTESDSELIIEVTKNED